MLESESLLLLYALDYGEALLECHAGHISFLISHYPYFRESKNLCPLGPEANFSIN
jgi:hypothetical protein